jgi:CBS domain-containing protein
MAPTEAPVIESPATDTWRSPLRLVLVALLLGIAVEVLFHGHLLGISVVIWAALCASGVVIMAAAERVPPARDALWLVAPILFFAAMLSLRLEPMTVFLDTVLVLALFALWVRLFRSGDLFRHGWIDLGLALIWVPIESWIRPWPVLGDASRAVAGEKGSRSRVLAVVRGLLIALPIVIILGALLSAADVIFSDYVSEVLRWLGIDRIVELLGRTTVVVVSGLFFLGAMVAALRPPGERRLIGEERPLVTPFLGFIESTVVLGAVNLLFAAFVAVQFAYLFGGEANITATGYTYSEYARRGFGELVAASVLTGGLILALGTWGRREIGRQRTAFHALSVVLVALVGVILASALMRLLLYENAYGFTRLRTYTHVAILWMGVMFVAFLVLLLAGRLRMLAPLALLAVIGFTATLNLLNVDGFIVRQNSARLTMLGEIDVVYLSGLTFDAAPGLVRLASTSGEEVQDELLPNLACWQAALARQAEGLSWPSYHLSRQSAAQALATISQDLRAYPVSWAPFDEDYPDWGQWTVEVDGESQPCPSGSVD